jgi:hypothetical protein
LLGPLLPVSDQIFKEPYFPGPTPAQSDLIARADVIAFSVNGSNELRRTNLGDGTSQLVAENISNLTLSYAVIDDLNGEVWVNSSAGTKPGPPDGDGKTYNERDIRRVQVTLEGSVTVPSLGTKTRSLTSTIKVRNMGMDTL